MSIKKVQPKSNIDTSLYVNSETGEALGDELLGKTVEVSDKASHVIIHSHEYTIVDSKAMSFLREHLNRSELGSIGIMTEDLKTSLNIIYNNNVPHTNESLQRILRIASNSTFNLLIRKLMKLGVLYQIKGNIMGKIRVIYMMNPFLARKRKQLDINVIDIFKEFKE
jgi:hypothetical protein